MTDDLHVLLEDRVAGTVGRLRGGRLRFRYDDAYRRDPASTPLSLSMPVAIGTHEDAVVAPWLQRSLSSRVRDVGVVFTERSVLGRAC